MEKQPQLALFVRHFSMGMYDVLAQHLIPDGAPAPVPEHLTAWPLSFPLFISASFVWATD